MDGKDATKARLHALRTSFLASLPTRIAAVRSADPTNRSGLEALRDAAHQLSGTAPVFGLAGIGAVAAEIEALADPLCPLSTGHERHRLDELLAELESSAAEAQRLGAS
jgi:HPt (histidine-containing phosphotransfer) domain-containing protein